MQHVGGRIGDLCLGELLGAPVGELLLLGEVDAEHLAHQVLEPMLVRIGSRQPRRDFGAIDRDRHDPERAIERGDIETGEMKDFQHGRIG